MKKKLIIVVFLMAILCVSYPAAAYHIKGLEKEIETQDVDINGKKYVLLVDVCDANGIDWEWDSVGRKICLTKNGLKAVFMLGSKYYYAGGSVKKLSAPVIIKDGYIYVPLRFARYKVGRLFKLSKKYRISHTDAPSSKRQDREAKRPAKKKYGIKKIVIDPGHGGKDPGAVGKSGLYEKTVVLDVSKRLKNELEEQGIDVVMTRDTDVFIRLGERARIANRNKADLFVSVHANANRRSWINGFEVYCLSEKPTDDNARALAASENAVLDYEEDSLARDSKMTEAIIWDLCFDEHRKESIELAEILYQEVGRSVYVRSDKVRGARFYVLKGTEMPAVLVELSYLSNRRDEENLKKASFKQKLAEGIASGIMRYKREYEKTNGFSR